MNPQKTLKTSLKLMILVALVGTTVAQEPWQADPELVDQLSTRPNHDFNYRESNVAPYQLPNVFGDQANDVTAASWTSTDRGELVQLFRQHVYGRRPDFSRIADFKIVYEVVKPVVTDPTGGNASGQLVNCNVKKGEATFKFPFLIYKPKNAGDAPLPFVVLIDNRQFPDPDQMVNEPLEFWPLDLLIESGFATAVFHTSSVDPDRADGYGEGVRGFLADGKPREKDSWGSLSAWGWGASLILDYAQSNLQLDENRVAVVGHSRGGKTALWAGAEDPRFTIVYSNESGCGGAALSRRRYGETVARITKVFPHWFCEKFSEYGDRESALPVDQHQLIGLIAPRAVYVASASEDLWADPRGEYLSLINAAPVYRLFGKEAVTDEMMPPIDSQRTIGKTGYHIRSGKHDLKRVDWQYFINFVKSLDKAND